MPWTLYDEPKDAILYHESLADVQASQRHMHSAIWNHTKAQVDMSNTTRLGSDKFRRNFTRVTNLVSYMKRWRLISQEQYAAVKIMVAATQVIYGGLLMYRAWVVMHEALTLINTAAAAAETTAKAITGPPGWAMIAFAGGMTVAAMAGLAIWTEIGMGHIKMPDINVSADFRKSSGRGAITSHIRAASWAY